MSGCRQNSMDETDGIDVIDVVNQLGKYQEIPVSEIACELEYIPLETGNECLLDDRMSFFVVTATHIFIAGNRLCYAFSRDGRFLTRIGRVGQGPGEYNMIGEIFVDEQEKSI